MKSTLPLIPPLALTVPAAVKFTAPVIPPALVRVATWLMLKALALAWPVKMTVLPAPLMFRAVRALVAPIVPETVLAPRKFIVPAEFTVLSTLPLIF